LKSLFYILIFGFLILSQLSQVSRADSVELHAHLFMKEGMTWAFRGDFFGPLQAKSFEDRFSSQANPEALVQSGASIVVATLYAHPLFVWNLRDSIRAQIALARKFVLRSQDWVLATEPEQAKDALAQKKHVLILALEGASGILETEDDLREFIDEGGIRIVGPLHLTDDEYGGVAYLRGSRVLANPLSWILQFFDPKYSHGVRVNTNGLSAEGMQLVQKLIQRHVWIDLAHASDLSMNGIMDILEKNDMPLLYTHTVLRKYHQAERGISEEELARIAKSRGIVGLMPSEEMLAGAPRTPECPSAFSALAMEYTELAKSLGSESVMMGSDYNGGIPHLKPGCNSGTSIDREGLWNMGQIQELWTGLRALGAPTPEPLSKMSTRFVEAWSKIRPVTSD
jgi:membrane dipeptidase